MKPSASVKMSPETSKMENDDKTPTFFDHNRKVLKSAKHLKNKSFEQFKAKDKSEADKEQVSPELAAQIVKDFILPMFEGVGGKNEK